MLFTVKSRKLQNEFIAGICSWKCVLIACAVRPRNHLTFNREINISETKEMLTSVPHRASIIWRSNWKMRGSYSSIEGECRNTEVVKQWIKMKTILLSMIDRHMHPCHTVAELLQKIFPKPALDIQEFRNCWSVVSNEECNYILMCV